jgi:hypothetical protein
MGSTWVMVERRQFINEFLQQKIILAFCIICAILPLVFYMEKPEKVIVSRPSLGSTQCFPAPYEKANHNYLTVETAIRNF